MFYRYERLLISSTPVLTTSPYSANTQLGGINTLSKATADTKGSVQVESICVIDKGKQKKPFDLFFFNALPTLISSDNTAFDLSNAELLKCIGVVSIAAADYADTKNASVASKQEISMTLQAVAGSRNLYYVAVTRGAPTYSVGDLVINFGLYQP